MGKPRRSKGCTTCIQRKVKCDEKVPSCGQCLKGGRKCSGVASAIFMNMDSTTLATTSTFAPRDAVGSAESSSKPKEEEKTLIHASPKDTESPVEEIAPVDSAASPPKHDTLIPAKKRKMSSSTDHTEHSWLLSPPVQSTQVISQQFLSHFINFFARASTKDVIFNSWMGTLPAMLASQSQAPTHKSIAAASMIYYGRRTNDKAIMMEAYRSYGAGLAHQRNVLEDIVQKKRTPTVEELCTPLLMSFFEISCCTSPTAYFQHLFGAGKLLEAYGPERCQEGILFELFHTLRLQLNYASIATRAPSPFCTVPWLTVPFALRPKSIIDHLVDTITICTDLHSRCDLLHSTSPLATSYTSEKQRIRSQALTLKSRLDDFWVQDIRERAAQQGWVGDYYNGVRGFDGPTPFDPSSSSSSSNQPPLAPFSVSYPSLLPTNSLPCPPPRNREPFSAAGPTARPLGFYSTARLLVLSVLATVDAKPALYDSQMEAHSASLLSAAEFMTGLEVGYAYLRLILPLHVVGVWGGTMEQRMRARAVLEGWRGEGGMGGICEVVLGGLDIHAATTPPIPPLVRHAPEPFPAPRSSLFDRLPAEQDRAGGSRVVELADDDVIMAYDLEVNRVMINNDNVSDDDFGQMYPHMGPCLGKWHRLVDYEKRQFGYPPCSTLRDEWDREEREENNRPPDRR